MNQQEIQEKIDEAAQFIGKTWPLYSFVTANPLSGYEDKPFFVALQEGGNLWEARTLPKANIFHQAWTEGKIGRCEIESLLKSHAKDETPEFYLHQLEDVQEVEFLNESHRLDLLTVKWVSLFMDEGMAAWKMPFKERGFYTAWSILSIYDEHIRDEMGERVPKTPEEAISRVLSNFDEKDHVEILKRHLAALPGWAGYVKYRDENDTVENQNNPISLLDYLAVRLWMARCLRTPIFPERSHDKDVAILELKYIWLQAWELTWQNRFFDKITKSLKQPITLKYERPDVQLAFCLDSRSELLRRGLEKIGNYETYGSAGAFGMPIDYVHPETGLINKSSPAMLPSKYLVHEEPIHNHEEEVVAYKEKGKRIEIYHHFLKRMKNILPSAFGYVEGTGFYYGITMLLRLFRPNESDKLFYERKPYDEIMEPHICPIEESTSLEEISMEDKAKLVNGVFASCGWMKFAPLVVFTGHDSHSANNPFASSLDCGACAGTQGKRNARTLARLANTPEVKAILRDKYQINIPEDTIFIAGEHVTSSDEVRLFDHQVPESHYTILEQLKKDLMVVQDGMVKERLNEKDSAVELAKIKSNSWCETRPEWGLSGHAGYVIGPRSLTINDTFKDCFLSSYDWTIDPDGSILKNILLGPLLVCQWISHHYYFSTVDNDVFGSGSKITHNVTGKFGVMQGNGSDLKMGLPLQSLMISDERTFHNPTRLTTLIQAPKHFVTEIIEGDEKLKSLVDNEWMYVFVMDPEMGEKIERYI